VKMKNHIATCCLAGKLFFIFTSCPEEREQTGFEFQVAFIIYCVIQEDSSSMILCCTSAMRHVHVFTSFSSFISSLVF
jgi:hypothetical protein